MLKILFVGYNSKKTQLINYLKKNNKVIVHGQKTLNRKIIKNFDLIISFGYKKIIKPNILKVLKRPAINLHISYLPYNRGAHPNFWSFVDQTPKGVTIHEINDQIDSGKIILRKKIIFNLTEKTTFIDTYNILFNEIEKLFLKNSSNILLKKYKTKVIKTIGTYHNKNDLPKNITSWNIKILNYLNNL